MTVPLLLKEGDLCPECNQPMYWRQGLVSWYSFFWQHEQCSNLKEFRKKYDIPYPTKKKYEYSQM